VDRAGRVDISKDQMDIVARFEDCYRCVGVCCLNDSEPSILQFVF
jgi:hypothetical protein